MPEEAVKSRSKCIDAIFVRWRTRFCASFGKTEEQIVWRSECGTEFGPSVIANLYFDQYKPTMKKFMVDPENLLDRHKAISLTQQLFLERLPITFADLHTIDLRSPQIKVCQLNCCFVYYFGIQFLCRYHETHTKGFDSDVFCSVFHGTEPGKRFGLEHYKYLMSVFNGPYPAFMGAQLWFALEQWALLHSGIRPA